VLPDSSCIGMYHGGHILDLHPELMSLEFSKVTSALGMRPVTE
jgi:hypothetical protein